MILMGPFQLEIFYGVSRKCLQFSPSKGFYFSQLCSVGAAAGQEEIQLLQSWLGNQR